MLLLFPANLCLALLAFHPQFHADEFWGTICSCTSITPQLKSVIWNHCQFLQEQGISFYPYLGFFICTTHGFIVHPLHLLIHLKAHDLKAAVGRKTLSPGGWFELMSHIGRSFQVVTANIQHNLSPQPILPSEWSAIDSPVPGLPITLGFKCGLCGWLLGTKASMRVHHSIKHKKDPSAIIEAGSDCTPPHSPDSRVYVQRLFLNTASLSTTIFP